MEEKIQKIVEAAQKSLAAAERLSPQEPQQLKHLAQKIGRLSGIYPVPHVAVEVCCSSYLAAREKIREKNPSREELARIGQIAYCTVMPRLTGLKSIREFIACVVHGMAVGAIPSAEGTRLLYGAQIACTSLPSPKSHKKRHKTAQNAPGNQPATPTPSIT